MRQLGLVGGRFSAVQKPDPAAEWDHPGHRAHRLRQDHYAVRGAQRAEPPDRKIITAEDPVEYYLPGINQVEVKHNIGLDFALIIRSMLRQAPNVILVGEMRDSETAQMGIQASLTGHLVFSTLHTNDAPGAITRMIDMGVPGYLVASSVMAVLAQRLVRVVCSKCKQPFTPTEAALEAAGITPEMASGATFHEGQRLRALLEMRAIAAAWASLN